MEQTQNRGRINGFKVVLILPAILTCFAFLLKALYSLPFADSFLWYAGVFVCFYVPGNLILRWLDFNKDEHFINLFHSIALGAALTPLVYTIFRRFSHPEFMYVFSILMLFCWLIVSVKDLKQSSSEVYISFKDVLSVSVLLVVVFLVLNMSYFTDVVFLEEGFKIRNIYLTETDFHLGIINTLKEIYPPSYPYASGVDFSYYHLNMHLQIEMFNRFFKISTLELSYFYFPFLYLYLLVFIPYMFIRKFWGIQSLAVLSGLLMLGSDLSFIPGMFGIYPPDYPWADFLPYPWTLFFRVTLWGVLCLNGILPSLFVMSLCVIYIKNYFDSCKIKDLFVFSLLAFSAFGFKSSMGFHIIGVAFLTGVILAFMSDKKQGKLICLASLFVMFAIAVETLFFRGGVGNFIVTPDSFNNFKLVLNNLRLTDMPKSLYPVLFILYFLFTFGIRSLGFYYLKDSFRKKLFDPLIVFLSLFSLTGFFLSEMIYLGNSFRVENNAMWFAVQSLMGSWLLFSCFLLRFWTKWKRSVVITAVVLLLSFPSTIQFLFVRNDSHYYQISSSAMEVVEYLEKTPPGSVVLHPIIPGGISLASNLAGRSSVVSYLHTHVTDYIGKPETNFRLTTVELFFAQDDIINRQFVLNKFNVNYVYAPLKYTAALDEVPELLQVLRNNEYSVYLVRERG